MSRQPRASHVGIEFNNIEPVREKLIAEITKLERQLENLKLKEGPTDFSMLQTYKEMIQCRQSTLNGLPKDAH